MRNGFFRVGKEMKIDGKGEKEVREAKGQKQKKNIERGDDTQYLCLQPQ